MNREEAIKILKDIHDKALFSVRNALETLAPELRESEDERIRKDIIAYMRYERKSTKEEIENKFIPWLEKKKDAEEILLKAGLKPYRDGNKWCVLIGDNLQDGLCGFGDTIDEALSELLKDMVCQYQKQKEQKPAEWSEEDESIRKDIMCVLQSVKQDRWRNQMCDWLNTLPKRFVLTPKQECNMKYETLIDNVFVALMDYALCERAENNLEHAHHLEDTANKLKSLRPSWKPSEEQMGAIRTAIDVLRGQVYDGKELYPGTSHVLTMMLNYFQANNNDTKV